MELEPRVKIGSVETETDEGIRFMGVLEIDGETQCLPELFQTKREAIRYGLAFVKKHSGDAGPEFRIGK